MYSANVLRDERPHNRRLRIIYQIRLAARRRHSFASIQHALPCFLLALWICRVVAVSVGSSHTVWLKVQP